jgi:hypothetical protein
MTLRWHEQYLGKPWKHNPDPPHSFNCGEFVRWIYKTHFGVDSPVLLADTENLRSCIEDIRGIERYANFERVDLSRDFDIALMARGVWDDHIGVCVGSDILHCRPKVGVFLDDVFALRSMGWRRITYIRPLGLGACAL